MDMLGANLTINLRTDTLGLLGYVQWYLSLVTAFHANSIWTSSNGTHSSLIMPNFRPDIDNLGHVFFMMALLECRSKIRPMLNA
eukprot:scaffold224_cov276-Chaetoceros_neogracile.AAC.41